MLRAPASRISAGCGVQVTSLSRSEALAVGARLPAGGTLLPRAALTSASPIGKGGRHDVVCPPRMLGARVRFHGGAAGRARPGFLGGYSPPPGRQRALSG